MAGENGDKARLYEFIVRSFLATCSKPAVGFETRLEIDIAREGFSTTGQPIDVASGAMYVSPVALPDPLLNELLHQHKSPRTKWCAQ